MAMAETTSQLDGTEFDRKLTSTDSGIPAQLAQRAIEEFAKWKKAVQLV
jgi:hypothetical protein